MNEIIFEHTKGYEKKLHEYFKFCKFFFGNQGPRGTWSVNVDIKTTMEAKKKVGRYVTVMSFDLKEQMEAAKTCADGFTALINEFQKENPCIG